MQADPERVLYDGRGAPAGGHICVTATWCTVNGSRYPIFELDLLGVTRGRRDLRHGRKIVSTAVVAALLIATVVAIGSGWTRQIWAALAVATAGTVAITLLPSTVGAALRRPYEIWALYRGTEVLLFVTEDREQYGQVARALVRARELHGR
jgi:hypothetical protein